MLTGRKNYFLIFLIVGVCLSDFLPTSFSTLHSDGDDEVSFYVGMDMGTYIKNDVKILGHEKRRPTLPILFGGVKFNLFRGFRCGVSLYPSNLRVGSSVMLLSHEEKILWLDLGVNYTPCSGQKMNGWIAGWGYEAEASIYNVALDLAPLLIFKASYPSFGVGLRNIYSLLFIDVYQRIDIYRLSKLKKVEKLFVGPFIVVEGKRFSLNIGLYYHRFKGKINMIPTSGLLIKI